MSSFFFLAEEVDMEYISLPLFWLILGVVLLFLELALPGFIIFFFGAGALATSLVAYLFPISLNWQLAIFIAASLIALFSLRNIIQKKFLDPPKEGEEEDDDEMMAMPGERGVVCGAIEPPAEGRIKFSGSFWRATADEAIGEGEIVSVVLQKDLIIHVEKV